MAAVTLEQLTKVYDNGHVGVRELDLDIADGEFLVLVGPSGCGKSTALRMIAGLEDITSGVLRIGDNVVNDLPPKDRDVAMVFQNYALYPHMTVAQNIGFALKLQGTRREEIDKRVKAAAATLQLEEWLDRKPGQLSGGQRQRVAMGRAIVRDPSVFLMDEPLSNLDAKLRVQVRAEIARLQRELKTTTVYVTHDQVEAMTMGDRVAVLRDGALQQVAEPEVLYSEPLNIFVAAFIGSPSMNLLVGHLAVTGDGATVAIGEESLELPPAMLAERPAIRSFDGRDVIVGIRPEALSDATLDGVPSGCRLRAEVELREALGAELLLHLRVDAQAAVTDEARDLAAGIDNAAIELLERQAQHGQATIVARFSPQSRARVGDVLEVAVAVDQVHLFEPGPGLAIRS
ncbi:MAG: sn-glycerol-3-phosphate ABC transporter ATP-binding protein UgpC [Acidimicrobiales bacterium]|nr:sn-glycerol-3-phosphate ABC transporter ATP-binding protein UgpC [Acidimicrobiales bacterium]